MKPTTLALALLLTGCNLVDPEIPTEYGYTVTIQICMDGWLWDTDRNPILNQFGQMESCSEAAQ